MYTALLSSGENQSMIRLDVVYFASTTVSKVSCCKVPTFNRLSQFVKKIKTFLRLSTSSFFVCYTFIDWYFCTVYPPIVVYFWIIGGCLQYPAFTSDPPTKYWPVPTLVGFGDRTRACVFSETTYQSH